MLWASYVESIGQLTACRVPLTHCESLSGLTTAAHLDARLEVADQHADDHGSQHPDRQEPVEEGHRREHGCARRSFRIRCICKRTARVGCQTLTTYALGSALATSLPVLEDSDGWALQLLQTAHEGSRPAEQMPACPVVNSS